VADQNPEQQNRPGGGQPAGPQEEQPENLQPEKKKKRRLILIVAIVVAVIGAGLWWWHSTYYEDTDDAQVNGNLIQISARINGHVIAVNVEQNEFVKAGQVLVKLDPSDYETTVEKDEANLASAKANLEAVEVNMPVVNVNTSSTLHSASADLMGAHDSVAQAERQLQASKAQVLVARANYTKAKLDLRRYTPLVEKDVISKQQYDAAVATAAADQAALQQAEANVQASEEGVHIAHARVAQAEASLRNAQTRPKQLAIQKARIDQAAAQVQQAQAALAQAKLNLSYCVIKAPTAGIVTTKSVQVGENLSAGQNLMTLVSLDNLWVTANFKETQIDNIHRGEPVQISVDALDGEKFAGRVTEIGGATGSMLSLFPPENATGNYVKVVQRIPVRIDFTKPSQNKDHRLRPGMSVEPRVRVK
jgi:membrane fusion protein (multidrug efflux system)